MVPFIDYDAIAAITDKRIVKSRRSIFESLVKLLENKRIERITVTELCTTAMLNRKTFYAQYASIDEAFVSIENHIIKAFLLRLQSEGIINTDGFKAGEYIRAIDSYANDNKKDFDTIYPYLRSGDFLHLLGTEVGSLGNQLMLEYQKSETHPVNPMFSCALVFTICGLITFYFDWIDLGKRMSLDDLCSLADSIVNTSLEKNTVLRFTSQ